LATALLAGARRVLRPGGRLVLVQPNFRLDPGRYFDDFTHVAIYTDRSLHDYLVSEGWEVTHLEPRFLPLTMKSRAAALSFLVPLYLRSPIRPLAGQMIVSAEPAPGPGGALWRCPPTSSRPTAPRPRSPGRGPPPTTTGQPAPAPAPRGGGRPCSRCPTCCSAPPGSPPTPRPPPPTRTTTSSRPSAWAASTSARSTTSRSRPARRPPGATCRSPGSSRSRSSSRRTATPASRSGPR